MICSILQVSRDGKRLLIASVCPTFI